MLKKLYKHEFKALTRWIKYVWLAILVIAILNRITLEISIRTISNSQGSDFDVLASSLLLSITVPVFILHGVAIGSSALIATIITVVRFYKNMFSHEGYFTFSIPVKPVDHLWCKLLCGVAISFITSLMAVLSVSILFIGNAEIGEIIKEVFLGIGEILGKVQFGSGALHVALFSIEGVILLIASLVSPILTFYVAIVLGQSFKNRIGGAILCYFVINVIVNFASNIFNGILNIAQLFIEVLSNSFSIWLVHIYIAFTLIFQVGLCIAFFKITQNRITKKLNLE